MVFADYYLPGFKAGGPIASVSRIIEIADEIEFRLITRDRDLGDLVPFENHKPRTLSTVGRAQVMYMNMSLSNWRWVREETKSWLPDAYYFNSAHSLFSTLVPLALMKLHVLPKVQKVIIAPRGEFGAGALSMKSRKKSLFKPLIRWLLPRNVVWHASSPHEVDQIRSWMRIDAKFESQFVVAPDPPVEPANLASPGPVDQITFTFASRIDRMKGLDRANRIIEIAGREISFTWSVQGSVTDHNYLLEIDAQLSHLPASVTVIRKEAFNPSASREIFSRATAFVFPTLGENFGHVIAEALSVGCPVFVTANTPWTELIQSGGGKVITTEKQTATELVALATMAHSDQQKLRKQVHALYRHWFASNFRASDPFLAIFPANSTP